MRHVKVRDHRDTQHKVSGVEAALEDVFTEIFKDAARKWSELMISSPKKSKHRSDIFLGARADRLEPLLAEFSIVGFRSVRVELGWAPPRAGELEDGLGTYTGQPVSMVPFVLRGSPMKIIPLIVARSENELMRLYKIAYRRNIKNNPRPLSDYEQVIKGIRIPLKTKGVPSVDLEKHTGAGWPKFKKFHTASIFDRVFHAPTTRAKDTFMIFRSMVWAHENRLWNTKGVPPANTLEKLAAAISSGRKGL